MAGVLNFALGLETTAFLRNMTESSRSVLEFLGLAEAGTKIMEQFGKAMEHGARLWNTSMATGQGIRSLFQIESALKGVGVSAEQAEPLSLKLQRALSGISETGESTALSFALLGQNMQLLRAQDPSQQLLQTFEALNKLDRASQVGVAANLFGRFNTGPALQIARQIDQFKEAFGGSAAGASIWAQMAQPFSKVLITVGEIKEKFETMFAAAARGFIVPLQGMLDQIKKFDWENIGKRVGYFIGLGFEIIKQGKLGEAIGISFKFGFDFLWDAAPLFAEFFGDLLLMAFKRPIDYLMARTEWAVQQALFNPNSIFAAALDPAGFALRKAEEKFMGAKFEDRSDSFQKIFQRQQESGTTLFGVSFADMAADVKQRAGALDISGRMAEFAKALQGLLKPGTVLDWAKVPPTKDENGTPVNPFAPQLYKPTVNQFEKMGFVFGGSRNAALEWQRRAALAAERTANILAQYYSSDMAGLAAAPRNAP